MATLTAVNAQCEVASITAPTATDNCAGTVVGTTTTIFPITSSTTVVWTFSDGTNTSTQNQIVNIITVDLVITDPPPACYSDTVDITQSYITAGSIGNGMLSYWSNSGATIPLTNPTAITTDGIYYIKSVNGNCFDIAAVAVIIKELPTASIYGETICYNTSGKVNFTGTPNAVVTYTIDGGTNQMVTLNNRGDAFVSTPSLATVTNYELVSVVYSTIPFCEQLLTGNTVINVVEPVTDFSYAVTNAFEGNSVVKVTLTNDNGSVSYQMDNETPQQSNVFNDVSSGKHTIRILDSYGCTNISKEISILGYPKFFTPNGDGYNDYWNIIGLENRTNVKLRVYDRYGKFIISIEKNGGMGWDGRFNGAPLPATDYWFTLEYQEDNQAKVFKSHFSLKR